MVNLADAVQVLVPGAVPLQNFVVADRGDGAGPQVVFWSLSLPAQPTAQQLAAVTAAQVAAYTTGLQRSAGDALLADPGGPYKLQRAVLLLAIDQLNVLREWCMALQTGTAGAGTLAAFKAAVAALPALPDITGAAARAAVQSKIDGGAAD